MNIESMTGYGRAVVGSFKVETRSTNHRNLEIRINAPQYLYSYEPEVRNIVKKRFHRGRIEIFVSKSEENNIKLKINKSLAKEYYHALISLKEELSISDNIGINLLAAQKDIFSIEEPEVEISSFRSALEAALEELKKTRIEEGKNLVDDITKRKISLNSYIAQIEDKRSEFIANARATLTEKLKTLLNNTKITIDDARLTQEIAILLEKSDITEEIVRIKSHIKHMEGILRNGDVIGKKMEFLAQELNRELNTIGSKASNAEISVLVVEMKHELEKIREQIHNLQ